MSKPNLTQKQVLEQLKDKTKPIPKEALDLFEELMKELNNNKDNEEE